MRRWFLFGILLLLSSSFAEAACSNTNLGNGITCIASATGGGSATATTITASALNVAINQLLVVGCTTALSGTTMTVSDTASNTFTSFAGPVGFSNQRTQGFYSFTTAANASDVVQCNLSPTDINRAIVVLQYSGTASSPLDATATGTANATSVTSGTFTTVNANEVSVAIGSDNAGGTQTFTAGGSYTKEATGGGAGNLQDSIEQLAFTSIQTGVTASMSSDQTGAWGFVVGTFKAAVVASGVVAKKKKVFQ